MTTFTMRRRLDDTKIKITNGGSSWKNAFQIYNENLDLLRIRLTTFESQSSFC
jgi:hypothetical protein